VARIPADRLLELERGVQFLAHISGRKADSVWRRARALNVTIAELETERTPLGKQTPPGPSALPRRFREHFRGPAASNPKLIGYLAAGSVKGLSPLRYERRVTRNRLVALTLLLSFVIWAIVAASIRH
jgi:hypothetical protein